MERFWRNRSDGGEVSLERRRVVEETLAPGASVARVAPDNSSNHYQYDTLNRLGTPTNSLTGQFSFGYDALSRRTQLARLLRPFIRS